MQPMATDTLLAIPAEQYKKSNLSKGFCWALQKRKLCRNSSINFKRVKELFSSGQYLSIKSDRLSHSRSSVCSLASQGGKMRKKLCLVCSSGGHLFQLYALEPFWSKFDRFWVTFPQKDANYLLKEEKFYRAYHPTNRNMKNFFKNFYLAFSILLRENPDFVISTGAGVGVPFLYVGRLLRKKVIYIESMTRIHSLSLTGKLVYPVVHRFLVQWPELAQRLKKAEFHGQVI